MHEIGNEEVGVELLLSRQVSVWRSNTRRTREQRVVLQDQPHRKLRSELPVPFTAQDVIVEDAATRTRKLRREGRVCAARGPQPLEQVNIFNLQRLNWPECQRSGSGVLSRYERLIVRRDNRGYDWHGFEVDAVSPVIAGPDGRLLEIAGLETGPARVLVIVEITGVWASAIHRISIEAEVLRAQPLTLFFKWPQIDDRLPAAQDCNVRRIVRVEAQSSVVKVILHRHGRPPVDNPAFLRTKAVVHNLRRLADIGAIDESRHRHKAGADVVVNAVVGKVQAVAMQFEFFGGTGIVIVVATIAGTEGVKIGFAIQAEIARTGHGLAVERPVGIEFQVRVDATDAVEFSGRRTLPIGIESTHTRLAKDVAAHARDREIGTNAGELSVVGHGEAGAAIVRRHQAHGIRTVFSSQADDRSPGL